MVQIRAFARHDIPAVVDLYQRVFGLGTWVTPDRLASHLERAFLSGPWYDEEDCSLVCLDSDGGIAGFLAVLPRPMLLQGRPVRAAVSSKFMVDPQRAPPLAAISMLKAFLGRPRDLALADLSNDESRRVWEGVGGQTVLLYSLSWLRLLQPCRYVASWVGQRPFGKPLALAARPLCSPADALFARLDVNRLHRPPEGNTTAELDEATFLGHYAAFAGPEALRPDYDERSLRWLWDVIARTLPTQPLRKQAVRTESGQVIGWYVYFLARHGVSEVLHVASRKGSTSEVLHHLFADAWRNGSTAMYGRVSPSHMKPFSTRHAFFRSGPPWMLVHSKRPEILEALHRGVAFLSRLEGEW